MPDSAIRNPESAGVSILLVDDHAENLLALESSLERLGHRLVKARSGREALRHLLTNDFALIILDVQMPEMDGFETANLIRQRERSRNTPIIFMTAVRKADAEIYQGYTAGAVDYLFKPFSPEILRAKVGVFVELFKVKANLEQQILEASRLNQELTRSNKDLDEFAYVISHDLNEPLRAVKRYVKLLRTRYGQKLEPEADQFLSGAERGAARMKALISDLLSLSRVKTRALPFKKVNTSDIVRDVLETLPRVIERKGAGVTCGDLPEVMADPVQMTQLFQNLIGNALKFHGERPPAVLVSAEFLEKDAGLRLAPGSPVGPYWKFSIKDNGIGIAEEHFERIFGVFQRLHTEREYQGSGIGLAICKKIVERHGGHIWVDSTPGEGSTFCFTLPGVVDSESQVNEERQTTSRGG